MAQPIISVTGRGVMVPQQVAQLGYQQLELRKRIAMQMMQQRAAAQAKMLQQQAAAQQQQQPAVDPMVAQQQEAQEEAARQERLRLLTGGRDAGTI